MRKILTMLYDVTLALETNSLCEGWYPSDVFTRWYSAMISSRERTTGSGFFIVAVLFCNIRYKITLPLTHLNEKKVRYVYILKSERAKAKSERNVCLRRLLFTQKEAKGAA